MNYEKKYKEALERASELYNNEECRVGMTPVDLEVIFPEPKESSEGKKIKKQIISFLKEFERDHYRNLDFSSWIAWLEKQSTPQVRTGLEWLNTIDDACDKRYAEEYAHGEYCHEQSFKWGFQEGVDWLEKQGEPTDINPSEFDLRLNKLLKQFETLPKEELASSLSFYLNVVQNDGTYKAEEKQGEQKPADKVEPFGKYEGLTDFERTVADICIGWIGKEYGWKKYIKDNADILLKIAIEKFNSVQDATFEQKPTNEEMKELLHTEYEKGRADAISEMKNHAWSDDDEKYINDLTDYFECNSSLQHSENDVIDWLKSLKPQPKQEWSEEDERNWNNIWDVLDGRFELSDYGYKEAARWFLENCPKGIKSLKPQNHWKPSKEQMESLHDLNLTGNISYAGQGKVLIELYNDLKKLAEE